jgi:hypothetical protein
MSVVCVIFGERGGTGEERKVRCVVVGRVRFRCATYEVRYVDSG